MQRFQNSYYAWLRNLHVAGDRTVRVAFRLEAPLQQAANTATRAGDAWQLHFLLQARDDPSLLIPAEQIWQSRGNVALGDTTLTKEEFDALVALKSPLVQIRGQWVELDPNQIEAAIEFWERHDVDEDISLHEALGIGLGANQIDGLPVEEVEFEGWLADWMQRFTGNEKLDVLPQPQSLQATLRPYQAYGYSWIDRGNPGQSAGFTPDAL